MLCSGKHYLWMAPMPMLIVTISFGQTACGGMKITKAEDHSINSCYSFPDFGPQRQLKRHRIAEAAYMDVIKACKNHQPTFLGASRRLEISQLSAHTCIKTNVMSLCRQWQHFILEILHSGLMQTLHHTKKVLKILTQSAASHCVSNADVPSN